MAEETAVEAVPPQDSKRETIAFFIGVAGWLVPGLGHDLLKIWGRAVMRLVTVGFTVILSAGQPGNVFNSRGEGRFDPLGLFAGLGTGTFFLVCPAL